MAQNALSLDPNTLYAKAARLADHMCYSTVHEMREDNRGETTTIGICMTPSCDRTIDEIDSESDDGYCQSCDKHTIWSLHTLSHAADGDE